MYIETDGKKLSLAYALLIYEEGDAVITAEMMAWLPGVEPAQWKWNADLGSQEELSAFYGDVEHELAINKQLIELALEDLCGGKSVYK